MSIADRLELLRADLDGRGLDGLLVTTPSNRRWVSGFTGSAGVVLVTRDEARFATDSRYWEQVEQQCPDYALVRVTGANTGIAPAILEGMGGKRIGFEPAHLSYAGYEQWTSAIAAMAEHSRPALTPAPHAIEDLRMVKDAGEIDALTRAVLLGDEAFLHASERIEPGMTEKDVAWLIQEYAITHGAESLSFDTIVAGGAHGSLPHWRASDAPLEAETGVVIDMGVIVDGYCSDLTRTVWLGDTPSDEFKRIYDIVLTAQETAEERIEAGMPGKVGHEIAHEVIRQAGYGNRFGHGLGHGVGLDIHEDPRLAPSGETEMADGHVVTVEPGIYIPGWGGVRIEDQCVMEDGRLRRISTAPKFTA
ncbi:MAG: Xaa-Pro peptidase family protein [Chloroflexi bacterium]|nr:Xaa-Pro peptidase family protein [Chloroflexota bacterium]MQC17128.1 aminopeptidase P family protein [Chloroflexota bacterium]MQC48315.1 aminopeptidase P family protein [Chloroflexota bacterium]